MMSPHSKLNKLNYTVKQVIHKKYKRIYRTGYEILIIICIGKMQQ